MHPDKDDWKYKKTTPPTPQKNLRDIEQITVTQDGGKTVVRQGKTLLATMYQTGGFKLGRPSKKLVFEVADTGDACFEMALAIFKHQRAFGCLPHFAE